MRRLSALCLLCALPALAACGGSDKEPTPAANPAPPAQPQTFPRGKTLAEIRAGIPEGPTLAPSVGVLRPGVNRFGFALFDQARKQMTGASVVLYIASATGANARGPYPVRSESLAVDSKFASKTTAQDPDAPKAVYVADLPFGRAHKQTVMAVARLDGRLVASTELPILLGAPGPPAVGARAVRVSTPTSPPEKMESIETRVPADTMHGVDFADVLGRRPVLLVFSTPALCQTRVCAPVVDAAEQLKATYGSRMAFIHMEIYKDNKVENGLRPEVAAWGLRSEPWVFAIDRRGRIVERFEGPVSAREMQQAIERTLGT